QSQLGDEINRVAGMVIYDLKIPKKNGDLGLRYNNGFICPQMDLSLFAKEMGHTSPHDNSREGNV
ncbi:MAG: hypothetical protein IKO63_05490, partial [Paludibacteraceae bacterium]|nr:hypothetical protein [Paludibacteraceae bacterium]